MDTSTKGWTLEDLARLLGGELDGPPDLVVIGPGSAGEGGPQNLGFAQNEQYFQEAVGSRLGAILIARNAPATEKPAIRVDQPRQAFAHFLSLCGSPLPIGEGVHQTAIVDPTAELHPSARVGAYCVIERGARIGEGVRIYPFCFVGENCSVGRDAVINPHVVLYQDVSIGERSIIHSGVILGADGFGFTWNGREQVKIPQIGKTEIGSDVELGANTTIDRATMGSTRIKSGAKIDNLVTVGHNSEVGSHTVIAGQAGISGSSSLGDRCMMAGQTGISDHMRVGNDVILTARAAVTKNIPGPGIFRGAPALPQMGALRYEASLRKVASLLERVKDLEARLAELERGSSLDI